MSKVVLSESVNLILEVVPSDEVDTAMTEAPVGLAPWGATKEPASM